MGGQSMKSKGVDRNTVQVRTARRATQAEKHSRIPRSILYAAGVLNPYERLVYAALADQVWQGNVACIGERLMVKKLGFARSTVQESLAGLIAKGFIEKSEKRLNNRNCYILLSSVFGQKQGREDVIVSGPRSKRYVSMDHDRHGMPARKEVA